MPNELTAADLDLTRRYASGEEGTRIIHSSILLKLVAAAEREQRLRTALEKYRHCRHACIDCFCTREARAAPGDEFATAVSRATCVVAWMGREETAHA